MNYISPNMEIIEFDETIATNLGVSSGNPNSTGTNENGNSDLSNPNIWN